MKRAISAILAILLVLTVFTFVGCSSDPKIEVEPGPLGRYTPNVKITYTLPFIGGYESTALTNLGYSVEETPWTEQIRNDLGIDLINDWAVTDNSAYLQKLSSAIVVGEIPDIVNVFFGEEYAYPYLKSIYNSELSAELSQLIEDYASDSLKESIEAAGEEIFYPATFDGGIYGFPQMTLGSAALDNVWWVRNDWLEAVGKTMPDDWDSFVDVMTALTKQDPDGNQQNDTYGLCTAVTAEHYDHVLFGSLGAYPYCWVEDGEGNLVYGSIQQSMKTALGKLADLYSRGVLYPDLSGNRYLGFMQNKVGFISGTTGYINAFNNLFENNDNVVISPEGAFSLNDDGSLVLEGNSNAFRFWVCAKSCKYPEVLIKLFNHFIDVSERAADDEALYEKLFTDVAGLSPVTTSALKKDMDSGLENLYEAIESRDPSYLTKASDRNAYNNCIAFLDGDRSQYGNYLVYSREGSVNTFYESYTADNFTYNKYTYSKTETMLYKLSALKALEYETYVSIITGEAELDAFDTFVETWKTQGGDEITQEVNEWYHSVK